MGYSNDQNIRLDIKVNVGEMRGLMSELGIDSKNDDLLEIFCEVMGRKLNTSDYYNLGEGLIYHPIEDIIEGGLGLYSKEKLIEEINKEYDQSKWTEEQWDEYWKETEKKDVV